MAKSTIRANIQFQSTLPTRGSDPSQRCAHGDGGYFNPRSPRGGATRKKSKAVFQAKPISIHAPHEGERPIFRKVCPTWYLYFNPRSPRGGATIQQIMKTLQISISIHAPHEGERRSIINCTISTQSISIHAPHEGERPKDFKTKLSDVKFQSTLPTRGSDYWHNISSGDIGISIHAPHEGERLKSR